MQTKDVDKLKILSTFLKDVLYSWAKASYTEPTCIGKEIIWNNSNITDQNKKTFFYHRSKWYDRGIKFIDHIYDYRIQRFYNFAEFKDLYQISEHFYLKYNSLIHNIPKTASC